MKLVDTNVLLHAVNTSDERHDEARGWLDGALAGPEVVGFCWVVLLGFVRIATRPFFADPYDADTALAIVDGWLGQHTATIVAPTARHQHILAGLLREVGSAGNLTTDAHIAALAIEHGADIVSYDQDYARFAGVTLVNPGAA